MSGVAAMARRTLGLSTLCLALGLGACAQLPEQVPSAADDALFEVTGRLAVSYQPESMSGSFTWRHGARSDSIVVLSPLGQGLASLLREPEQTTLVRSSGERFTAADPEALMREVLGWSLPVAGLGHWMMGVPAPGPAQAERDEAGRLASLAQDGWTIRFVAYGEPPRADLPRRIDLSRGELSVRIAVEQWLVEPPSARSASGDAGIGAAQ